MPVQTNQNLLHRAKTIAKETANYANTAERVGSLLVDIIDSMIDQILENPDFLAPFIRKDRPDGTRYRFEVGDFIDSLLYGKGTGIMPDGRIQTDKLEVRGPAIFHELIFNRLRAEESDTVYTECGTIESAEALPDGTWDIYLRKRWDNDFTALQTNDICYGSVNNLLSDGFISDSWFYILDVVPSKNKLTVRLFEDDQIPVGPNTNPAKNMIITRRGNLINKERQGFWYISSREGCVCFLDGVDSPILRENNYACLIGKIKKKELKRFSNLPLSYYDTYFYARGLIVQDIMRVNYEGVVYRKENNRGIWSLEVAQSDKPYRTTDESYDVVSHIGCEFMCMIDGTTEEPKFGSRGWTMIRGNPAFSIRIDSTEGWYFDAERIAKKDEAGNWLPFTTLQISGMLYNQDVTDKVLDTDVAWTRDTGNVSEDNAWATKKQSAGKSLQITIEDLGVDYMSRTSCKFKARALLRDGNQAEIAENYVTF